MGCSWGVYSSLLRAVLAVIMIGKTECYSYSASPNSLDRLTLITIEATTSSTNTINSVQTAFGSFTPSSSSHFSVTPTKAMTETSSSSIIMVPTTSFSTQRTSVLQQAPSSTSSISHGITSTVSATLSTSAPSSQISPARTSRSVQATSIVILIPPKVTCQENHMEIELDKNKYPNLNSSFFHLRDSSCVGEVINGRTIKLKTPLNSCNTTSKQTDHTITYLNEVRAERTIKKSINDTVTRHDALVLPFNCTYKRRKYVGVSFKPKRRVDAEEGAFGNFTFLMDLYSDNSYSRSYNTSDYPISVGLKQRLYIKYRVKSDKADLYVFAERCLATTTTSESTKPNYVFIDRGCTRDKTINYQYKTRNREQTFSIQAFRFIADHPVVYVHCLLLVCHSDYNTSKCAVGCSNSRARRDISRGDQESKLYHLSSGQIMLKKTTKTMTDTTTYTGVTVIALSSTVAVLVVGCLVLLALLRRRKKQSNKTDDSRPTQLEVYDNPGVNREDDPMGQKTSHQQDDANDENTNF